jgi:hypothetical protein
VAERLVAEGTEEGREGRLGPSGEGAAAAAAARSNPVSAPGRSAPARRGWVTFGLRMEGVEEVEDVADYKAHEVEDVEAAAHDAVVGEEEPGVVDGLDGEEAEDAHLGGWVLARPDPHDCVEEGLGEEGEARDLAAVLLLHTDAGEAGDPVDNEEADAVEHQVPEVLRALAVVGDLHGLGEVQHEDDLHEHVVANRAKIGKVCEQSPNAASKNGRPVKQEHLDRNVERELVPAY